MITSQEIPQLALVLALLVYVPFFARQENATLAVCSVIAGISVALLHGFWSALFCIPYVWICGQQLLLKFTDSSKKIGASEKLPPLYLVIGSLWLFASRAQMQVFGFGEPLVTLTANHFHYAGYLTPAIMRAVGFNYTAQTKKLLSLLRAIFIYSIPLTALGILGQPILEVIGTTLVGGSLLGWSLCTLFCSKGMKDTKAPTVCSKISSFSVLISMTLGIIYGLRYHLPLFPIDIQFMLKTHALLNSLGFVGFGILALKCGRLGIK